MMHQESQPPTAGILIVDDTHENLRLLSRILSDEGYHVRPVSNGRRALSAANAKPPDLVLLDIMMPDMDGYTVCQRLKADAMTRDVPVIFISALDQVVNKVKGFGLGAVDYITKPFEAEEVLSRVRTHLELRQMQRQLRDQNRQLHQEIAERKRAEAALQEANATKDTFFSILAHDLRSPFSSVLGSIEIALSYFDEMSREDIQTHLRRIQKSSETFYALLDNLLTWARIQRGRMEYQAEAVPVQELIAHLLDLFTEQATQKQVALHQKIAPGLSVHADINMLNTILRNLMSNALKFTPAGGSITLTAIDRGDQVEMAVSDTGIGIADVDVADLLRIDRKTSTLGTDGEHGTGLGLPLCQDLVEKNHGRLRIESAPGQGTTVTVTLPASRPPAALPEDAADGDLADADQILGLLQAVPAEWRARMAEAVDAYNLTQATALIEEIAPDHQALAEAMRRYARQFRFEILQALLRMGGVE